MVLPPSKRQKAQKWLGLDVQAIFSQSLRVQQVAPTSICKGGKIESRPLLKHFRICICHIFKPANH